MKKFRIVFVALVCGIACAVSLAACNTGTEETHTSHNWSSVYTEDGDRHYQTCDGCSEKKYSDHDYGASGVCVCGKVKPAGSHTHNYQWVNNGDGTHKQHCSVSGCTEPDKNNGSHDYGTTGVCVCGATKPADGHTHNYQWVDNGDGTHKQHCSVGGCNEPDINSGNHDYGTSGVCVCGAEKPSDTQTQYSIIFNANGGKIDGNNTKTIVGTVNQTISRPNDPVRTGYTFTGWYKDGATTVVWNFDTDTVKGATTLYAGWEMNVTEYDVTFVLNYSGSANVVRTTENGLITYIPERSDYIFNGWWYSDGEIDGNYILSEKFDTSERVTQSGLTLYAEWVQQRTDNSQLYSPSVSISADGVFSWQAVENAQSYRVEVYSGSSKIVEETLTVTSWTFPNGTAAGYYTVKIRANGDGENTINSVYTEKYYAHHILGAVSGIEFNVSTSVLTWDVVNNATAYEIRVNNSLIATISYTTYDLSELEAGDYTVSVTATREGYSSSTASKTISKKRLTTPNVTVVENSSDCTYTISWNTVAHANTYRIKHHNTYISVIGTSYTIDNDSPIYDDNGIGEFTVCAYDSNADYFISGDSESIIVKKIYALVLNRDDTTAGVVSSAKQGYKVGEIVTISANSYKGYSFLGWFDEENEVSAEPSYTFKMPNKDATYVARWTVEDAMSNFYFTSTLNTCTITRVKNLDSVSNIIIPDYVTEIGNGAFSHCSSLTSITIGNGVKSIGQTVFDSCSSLTSITIGNNVKSIGASAFGGCSSLTEITIPQSVTTIGYDIFYGCSNYLVVYCETESQPSGWYNSYDGWNSARPVVWDCNNNDKDNNGNAYCIIDGIRYSVKNVNATVIQYPSTKISGSIIIPRSVTYNGKNYGVTSIGGYAFYGCNGLTSIEIPNSITSIGEEAFYNCSSLLSIEIPASVTSVGEYAFRMCNKILIYCEIANKPSKWVSSWNDFSLPVIWDYKNKNTDSNGYEYAEIDGIRYSLNRDIAKVVGQPNNISGSIIIPNEVIYKDTTYRVMTIGNNAFRDCSSLTSIVVPDSVTSIEMYAFYNCSALKNIVIPDRVTSIGWYAFSGCSSLTSIVIPDNVTSIGYNAFDGCSSLTSIVIPDSVTSIGSSAFRDCGSLTSITVTSGNTIYHSQGNCLIESATKKLVLGCKNSVIPSDGSVTSIEMYAFYNCSALKNIVIPDSVTSIGSSAFSGCRIETATIPAVAANHIISSALKTVVITSGTSIGSYAFSGCSSLTSIVIPDSVTSIGSSAFSGCSSLTSIVIPDSVTSIGSSAFSGCKNLGSITIPFVGNSIKTESDSYQYPFGYIFGDREFIGGIETNQRHVDWSPSAIVSDTYYIPSSLKNVTVTGGNILFGAFYNCSGLTSITIPNNTTTIDMNAFYNCSSLTSIVISDSVTSIGDHAFAYCSSLTSIKVASGNTKYYVQGNCLIERATKKIVLGCKNSVIPSDGSVTSIGYNAFYGSSELTSIVIPDSVTSIAYNAFYHCSGLTSITVTSGNTIYHSQGNCLIETATKKLVLGCKNSVIPSDGSVTKIYGAFCGCSELTNITIPNSVIIIDSNAFGDCVNLTSIVVPDSVTSIGSSAFSGCGSLTSITFQGTKVQWNSISKTMGWNNETGKYIICCTDGNINK